MILDDIIKRTEKRIANLQDITVNASKEWSLKDAIVFVKGKNAVIAEIKYASPSLGRIRKDDDVEKMAREMIDGGCVALSILTEPYFFGGSTDNLTRARTVSRVPILRKDFIIDERQIYETKALRADAILLIACVLRDKLSHFVEISHEVGLEPLVEVHDQEDIHLALETDAEIIGINNRDLHTMKVDIETTKKLSMMARDRLIISESGIKSTSDVKNLKSYCDAFLIGSAIMSSETPRRKVEEFTCA